MDIIEKQRKEIERLKREKDEVEEHQKKEIRRLMRENAELKRQMTETAKYSIIPIDKVTVFPHLPVKKDNSRSRIAAPRRSLTIPSVRWIVSASRLSSVRN